MKIKIRDEGKKYFFVIPNFLLFSPLMIRAFFKYAPGTGSLKLSGLTSKKMGEIRRCVRKMKKIHKSLYLVEVEGKDWVRIKL